MRLSSFIYIQPAANCTFINSGETFEGEYRNGKTNGRGVQVFKNGSMFIGYFKNGSKHGIGMHIDSDGTESLREYKDGNQVRVIKEYKDS